MEKQEAISRQRVELGHRIRALRNAEGLSQRKLAAMAGMDFKYLYQLETGQCSPTVDMLVKISLALDTQLYELFAPAEGGASRPGRTPGEEAPMSRMSAQTKLGLRIRALRAARKIGQGELAYSLGISVSELRDIEKGRRAAGIGTIQRIADGLGVTLKVLFSDDVFDEPGPDAGKIPYDGRLPEGAGGVGPLLEMDPTDRAVLAELRANPTATIASVAKATGRGTATVNGTVARLKAAGCLRREGNNRSGRWVVAGGDGEQP